MAISGDEHIDVGGLRKREQIVIVGVACQCGGRSLWVLCPLREREQSREEAIRGLLAKHIPELGAGEYILKLLEKRDRDDGAPPPINRCLKQPSAEAIRRASRR